MNQNFKEWDQEHLSTTKKIKFGLPGYIYYLILYINYWEDLWDWYLHYLHISSYKLLIITNAQSW